MIAFCRALHAELLKTKRTLAFLLTLLAPLTVAVLNFAIYSDRGAQFKDVGPDRWLRFANNHMVFWAILMLPLFVTLETGLLNALEHGNKTWKQLYALPTPRWTVYAAKQVIAWALIGWSMVVLLGVTIANGYLLNWLRPEMGLNVAIPWRTLLLWMGGTYLASWLIISFHHWVSARWPSFVAAMSVGIVATVAAVIIAQSDKWVGYYPWTLPGFLSFDLLTGKLRVAQFVVGLGGGVLVALLGMWDVSRRDVA
jgi:lantibiotic transport system permease protein